MNLMNSKLHRKIKIHCYKGDKYKENIHNELFSLQLP